MSLIHSIIILENATVILTVNLLIFYTCCLLGHPCLPRSGLDSLLKLVVPLGILFQSSRCSSMRRVWVSIAFIQLGRSIIGSCILKNTENYQIYSALELEV